MSTDIAARTDSSIPPWPLIVRSHAMSCGRVPTPRRHAAIVWLPPRITCAP